MANITAFRAYLKNQHSVHAEARKAQTITIASPRDVCGIGWEDIDLGQAVWTVLGKDLSMPMIDMLTKVQHLSGISPYVLFDELTGGPLCADFLRFGAGDIREAFKGWAVALSLDPTLNARAAYLMGAANV